MPRTKIGNQGGFLDDRQFIDGLKVTFFVGCFFAALTWLNEGNQMEMGKRMMRAMFWIMSMPTTGTSGAKGDIDDRVNDLMDWKKYQTEVTAHTVSPGPVTVGKLIEWYEKKKEQEAREREEEKQGGPESRTIWEGVKAVPSRAKRKSRGALRKAFGWTRRK